MIIVVQEIHLHVKTIVLNVASSGIDYLFLYRVKTTYSTFCISLLINEESTCNIDQESLFARILIKTKLIIWDEVWMLIKLCLKHFIEP